MPKFYVPEFSYKDYLTYEIKKGDTTAVVAKNLGITVSDLRSYHNRYCPLEDLVHFDFPSHLKFLIIQPPKVELSDEQKEQQRKKVPFNDTPGKLTLNYSQGEKTYGVLYTIENGKKVHTIKQQIKISWAAENSGYHFYYITRDEVIYVNDTEVNTMAQEIAQKAAQALYPLLIVVDESGKWVYINNHDHIVERWGETKNQIRKYYKGEHVEKYFSIYDKNLADKDTLFLSMQKDWFLNALFNKIHVQYPPTKSIEKNIGFPYLAKTENIQYRVEQKIDDLLDVDNLIVIDINGKLDDSRTKTDFEKELNIPAKEYSEEKPTGNYRAKYYLNPNNYMPEAFIVTCDLALDIPQKYTISATHLHTAKELVIASRQPLFVGATTIKPKSGNSFWYWLIMILIFIAIMYGLSKLYIYKFK